MSSLVPCPGCACHVRRGEARCPHCDAVIARGRQVAPTAAALLLGLPATVTIAVACSSDVFTGAAGNGGAGPAAGSTVDPYTAPASAGTDDASSSTATNQMNAT